MNSPKYAFGYCRVSTKMQVDDGLSLDTQKEKIISHCRYRDLTLLGFYEDAGLSGKNMDRPALQKLLQDVTRDSYVIVNDCKRLGRDTIDSLTMLKHFLEKGVHLICLNFDIDFSTPVGEMMFTVMCAYGKMERRDISANVSANMLRASREGRLRNRPPFGYKFVGKDKDFEVIPEQIIVLNKILVWHDQGINNSRISKYLNDSGDNLVLSLNKKEKKDKVQIFYPETIRNILKHYRDGVVSIEKRIVSHHKPVENGINLEIVG